MRRAGLFIDLDGTLADSLIIMRSVYHQFLSEHAIQGSEAEFIEFNGPPLDCVVGTIKNRYQLEVPESKLLSRYMELVKERYPRVNPSPGAIEVLSHATERGWLCAVVTSNSEILAREWLDENCLLDKIVGVIGKESVRVGKPKPEPYLIALKALGCAAESSIAVEDSLSGILSATSAKIRTLVYAPNNSFERDCLPNEATVIRSLLDIKPWLTNV